MIFIIFLFYYLYILLYCITTSILKLSLSCWKQLFRHHRFCLSVPTNKIRDKSQAGRNGYSIFIILFTTNAINFTLELEFNTRDIVFIASMDQSTIIMPIHSIYEDSIKIIYKQKWWLWEYKFNFSAGFLWIDFKLLLEKKCVKISCKTCQILYNRGIC